MILQEFYVYLEKNRCYSERTISNYRKILKSFNSYLIQKRKRSIDDCEKINVLDVEAFYRWMINKWNTIRSCNVYLSCIKSYIRYCWMKWKNVINENIILRWKEEDKKIECMKDENTKKLLNYIENLRSIRWNIVDFRNFCLVWLFIYTWLRVSEIVNLRTKDIGEQIDIVWKWKKIRTINLFKEDLDVINDYLKLRKDKSEYLFITLSSNYYWKKLSTNRVEEIVRNYWKEAWLDEKIRPHKLRHTFATNLLRSWMKIEYIQKLLGHRSILTTQIYLTVENYEIRKAQENIKRF